MALEVGALIFAEWLNVCVGHERTHSKIIHPTSSSVLYSPCLETGSFEHPLFKAPLSFVHPALPCRHIRLKLARLAPQ